MRLAEFLTENRAELIGRCSVKVAARSAPKPTHGEIERGIPLFIDQLIDTLRGDITSHPDAAGVASRHGQDLMGRGFTVGQVVHTYGDVCQSVTDLAVERGESIAAEDFRVLNSSLDNAIAAAVTEFTAAR
ncbi:MAG: sensor histidine kinase, partial [Kofleriaceae bacterium]